MDGKIRTAQDWLDYFSKTGKLTLSDIEQIQLEAIEANKAKYYNPGNAARAERIKRNMIKNMVF